MDKSSINRLLTKFRDTGAVNQSTDSQVTADYEVPALKKMLTWLTKLQSVKKWRVFLQDIYKCNKFKNFSLK